MSLGSITDSPIDPTGPVYPDTFVSGVIEGNSTTLYSSGDIEFSGTITGNTITGTSNEGSSDLGTFTVTAQ